MKLQKAPINCNFRKGIKSFLKIIKYQDESSFMIKGKLNQKSFNLDRQFSSHFFEETKLDI